MASHHRIPGADGEYGVAPQAHGQFFLLLSGPPEAVLAPDGIMVDSSAPREVQNYPPSSASPPPPVRFLLLSPL
jgi:hypothetical protein